MTTTRGPQAETTGLKFDRPIDDDPNPGPLPGEEVELSGPIATLWHKLGGKQWGIPLNYPHELAGGASWVSFKSPGGRAYTKAIVHSPATGAHWLTKDIFDAWIHYRGGASLGYPTSDPLTTHDGQGRYQTFQNCTYVWHPQTGAHEVHGDIAARYTSLGGSAFGYPTTDESAAEPGGRFNHFLDVASGAHKSIYWTQAHGAWEVFGLIRNEWSAAGWQSGPLGFPTSGELATHDGTGRYQTFTGGIYVWHPKTGTYAVSGPILTRYGQLGGSSWAYPVSAEGAAANGGRYQHFRRVSATNARSIYWSQSTGAVEIVGRVRQKFEAMGWEHSHLGYPVSPQTDWNDEGAGGTQQQFTGGRILIRGTDNAAAADPVRFSQTINATGIRGEVVLSIPYNAPAHHGGWVRAVKQDSFDFLVNTIVRTPNNLAVTFSETGKIYGDLLPGPERYNFNTRSAFPVPTSAFWEFQNATLGVNKNYRSLTAGLFGDIVEFALKWIIGSVVIPGPGVALVLVGGTAAVTAATGGSFASGMRIVSGTLWLAGPWGTAFALAADGLARIASQERTLRPEEYDFAKLVFGGSLPPREQILVSDAIGGEGAPFTYPRFDQKMVLSMGDQWNNDLRTFDVNHADPKLREPYGRVLIHELTHVWQYTNNAAAISYVGDAIVGRITRDYEPGVEHKEDWDWFGLEEQGTLVDRWFKTHYRGPGYVNPVSGAAGTATADTAFGLASPAAINDPIFAYIDGNIRKRQN